MILDTEVEVKWICSIRKYYVNKGYIFTNYGEKFFIKIEDLPHGSEILINVKCDICGEEKKLQARTYFRGIKKYNYYTCIKCSTKKRKQTCLVEYGCEFVTQSEIFKLKSLNTMNKRYGCKSPIQNKEIKEKIKQTCLDKYGVENPLKNINIQEKRKQTCLDKYGCEFTLQIKEVIEKRKQTYLNKSYEEKEEIKEKIKQTCLDKYGCEFVTQSEIFKLKSLNTMIERYGEAYFKIIPRHNPLSISYLDIISNLTNLYFQHALNGGEKKFHKYWVDGYNEQYNICIEIDEKYHKKQKEKDKIRQEYIESKFGCKFIRINWHNIEEELPIVIDQINELKKQSLMIETK